MLLILQIMGSQSSSSLPLAIVVPTKKYWAYFGKGKMKHNFFKMCFLFKFLFSSPDHNQPFIILNSEVRFSLTSFLLIFQSAEIPQQAGGTITELEMM